MKDAYESPGITIISFDVNKDRVTTSSWIDGEDIFASWLDEF